MARGYAQVETPEGIRPVNVGTKMTNDIHTRSASNSPSIFLS